MRHKSVLTAIGAIAAVGITLTGCSSNAPAASSGTITVARLSGSDDKWKSIADKFHELNPGLTIEYTIIPTDSYNQQMGTRLSAGTATDVLNVFPGSGNATAVRSLAKNGYLADLSGEGWAATQPESTTSATSYEDKRYMFTDVATANTLGGVYNAKAVQDAGLKIPTTYSEVLTFCADAQKAGKVAYALGAQTQWVTQLVTYALAATDVYSQEPDFNQKQLNKEATFQDSKWLESMTKYKEMFDKGCFNKDALGTSVDNQTAMVADGRALGAIQISTMANSMTKANPALNVQLAPLPATDTAADTRLAFGLGVGWGINAKAKNADGAKKFLAFLASKEGSAMNADKFGVAPNGAIEANEINKLEIPFVEDEKTVPFPDVDWPSPQVQNLHLTGIQEMLGGSKTPKDVLTFMQEAFTGALK
ncbi:extracellular solute-binding protein [Pseudarthrobacter sulfonivorans]|uniref:ABC transporter substrate-binding protein n=1 Tax=Pseudarthrobacter sulfonivorans TaxID=121292 RepID=UPI002862FA65|nr:extracellular solute-binding protein [Pseudarthrobacter sulfonivorans]MDR6415286.1 raffinose/stachyose/melibiose transport system substrate-binding protein [Pseudarthrobacter sulfonivorans]